MVGCSIRNCKSRSVKGGSIRFFSFPQKESIAKEWLRYCGPNTTTKNGRVCSNHFLSTDYFKSLKQILLNETPTKVRNLKPDAIPTLHINDKDKQNTCNILIKDGNEEIEVVNRVDIEIECTSDDTNTDDNAISAIKDDVNRASNVNTTPGKKSDINIICNDNITPASEDSDTSSANIVEDSNENEVTITLAEYKRLKRTCDEHEALIKNLKNIFSPGQIRCLMKPDMTRVNWSAEDIAAAIWLRKHISPKSYRQLRATVGIPLPSFSTLGKWKKLKTDCQNASLNFDHTYYCRFLPRTKVFKCSAPSEKSQT